MMDWIIAHNMGILLIMAPIAAISWILAELNEKIRKIIKKALTK